MGKKDEPSDDELRKRIDRAKEDYDIKKYVDAFKAGDAKGAGKGAAKLREHLKKKDK